MDTKKDFSCSVLKSFFLEANIISYIFENSKKKSIMKIREALPKKVRYRIWKIKGLISCLW